MEVAIESNTCFDEQEMTSIVKNIYASCDPEETNAVPVSKLIDFIKPYMIDDLNALETLEHALDPENMNVHVSSEKFLEVMSQWSKRVANPSDENCEFNRTPSDLDVIDDKELPYTHSTPRASIGQKLLKCKDLLNLSNVSSYSLSTSKLDTTVDVDKTILEEEIKKLEHQLSKVTNEMMLIRLQLTASEEQNETLQSDVERLNRRLHAEQQLIDHLQKDKKFNEELREELSVCKKSVEDLKKKLSQSEKDSQYLNDLLRKSEEQKAEFEKKCEILSRKQQEFKKEIFDVKTGLDMKEEEMSAILKINDQLQRKLNEQKDLIDQLQDETEILNHQKNSLENVIKGNKTFYIAPLTSSPDLGTHNSFPSIYNSPNFINQITHPVSPIFESPVHFPTRITQKSQLLKHVLLKNSTPKQMPSLLDESLPECSKSLPVLSHRDTNNSKNISSPFIMQCVDRTPTGDIKENASSEEDIYWKFQDATSNLHESLQAELYKADENNPSYPLSEKNEKLIEIEFEFSKTIDELKQENDDLRKRLESVEERNRNLCDEIEKTSVYNGDIMRDLGKICTEIGEKERILETIRKEKNDLEEEVMTLKHLKSKCAELEAAKNGVQESNLILANNLACKDTVIESLQEKLIFIELEKRELEKNNDIKDKEIKDFKDHMCKNNENIINDLEAKMKQNVELEDTLMTLKISNKTLESQIEIKTQEIKDLFQKLSSKSVTQERLNKRLKEMDAEILKLKSYLLEMQITTENLKTENEKLKTYIEEKDDKIQEFEQDLKKHKMLEENLEKVLNDKKRELSENSIKISLDSSIQETTSNIQQFLEKKNAVIQELAELNKKLQNNLNGLSADLETKVGEITDLRNKLKSNVNIKNNLWKNIQDLQTELKVLKNAKDELLEKQQDLLDEIEDAHNEHGLVLNLYDNEMIKNSKLNGQITRLKQEQESLLLRCSQEASTNEELRMKYSEQSKEYNNLLEKYNKEIESNGELQQKSSKLKEDYEILMFKHNEEVNRNVELAHQMSVLTEEYADLLSKHDAEIKKNIELVKDISEMQQENERVNSEYKAEFKKNEELNQKLLVQQEEYYSLLSKYNENVKVNIDISNRISEKENQYKDLSLQFLEVVKEKEKLQEDINVLRNEKEGLILGLKNSKDCYNNLQVLLNKADSDLLKIRTENQSLVEDIQKERSKSSDFSDNSSNCSLGCERSNFEPKSKSFIKQQMAIERLKEKIEHIENQLIVERSIKETLLKTQNNWIKERNELQEKLLNTNEGMLKLKNRFEQVIEENKNLELLVENSDDEIHVIKLKLKDSELKLQNALAEIVKNNEHVQCLTLELTKKEDELQQTLMEVTIKDHKIQSIINELKEEKVKNENNVADLLEKGNEMKTMVEENIKLQEMLSKSDDRKEKELMDVEEKCKNARDILHSSKLELELIQNNINDAKKEFFIISSDTNKIRQILHNGRKDLKRATLNVFDCWINQLDIEGDEKYVSLITQLEDCRISILSISNFQEELHLLNNQINITVLLLEFLASRAPLKMEELSSNGAGINENQYSPMEGKTLNKFTLCAPTLALSRPESPDSLSAEIGFNGALSAKKSFETTKDFQINGERESDNTLENLTNKSVICTEEGSFHITFPNLSDEFLESLGLHESSSKKVLSKEETESLFMSLALQLSVNSKDIKERLETHRLLCNQKQEKYLDLIRDISDRLRDHICIGTTEPINPVYVLLEELRFLLNDLLQCVGQFGILNYELRMKKCWNLVVNYTAILRQENESLHNSALNKPVCTPPQEGQILRRRVKKNKSGDTSFNVGDTKEINRHRKHFFCTPRITVTTVVIMIFFLFIGCVFFHWHCRENASSETQSCPLDFLITRKYLGLPPV